MASSIISTSEIKTISIYDSDLNYRFGTIWLKFSRKSCGWYSILPEVSIVFNDFRPIGIQIHKLLLSFKYFEVSFKCFGNLNFKITIGFNEMKSKVKLSDKNPRQQL
jgi:hypothetical protein